MATEVDQLSPLVNNLAGDVVYTDLQSSARTADLFKAKQLTGICFWPDREYEVVVILPSITETAQALARTKGISYYEHRTLFNLALLRDFSIKRVVFLCSIPVDQEVLRYYWSMLLKDCMPFSEVERRFLCLAIDDASVRPLSHKILDSPEFMAKVRSEVGDPKKSCLIPWLVTPAEHEVAERVGVPILSHEPEHYTHGTKAGGIKIFQEANVPYPFGSELVRTEEELASSLFDLWRRGAVTEHEKDVHQMITSMEMEGREILEKQHLDRYVVKLDDSASGGGNAVFNMSNVLRRCGLLAERERIARLPDVGALDAWILENQQPIMREIVREFPQMAFQGRDESWPTYRQEIPTQGVHVELYIDHQFAPSCQAIIDTDGQVTILSTHEQILDGHVYQGMPPLLSVLGHTQIGIPDAKKIQEYTIRVGRVLAQKGALGNFGVDFLASRTMADAACLTNPDSSDTHQAWELFAVEINLRQSGTTHPMMLSKLLTRGSYDSETGMIKTATGALKYYVANDNVVSPRYTALTPASVVAGATLETDVHYCPKRETGVMFHLLSPVREMGKVGIVCLGDSRQEADQLAARARKLLDRLAADAESTSASPSAGSAVASV